MRVFCDTSVLVAGSVREHPHFNRAVPVLKRIVRGEDTGIVAAHSLAETFAVLTTLPVSPRITPFEAHSLIRQNILSNCECISLEPREYEVLIEAAAMAGLAGGVIYDTLILECAKKANPDRIYTFNVKQFRRIGGSDLSDRISAP